MGDGDRGEVRESRSIIFYAWAGLAVQSVLAAGVIAFALAGSERSAGAGLGWVSAILAAALMLSVIAVTAGRHRVSRRLHAATTAACSRAAGATTARAV